MVAICSPQVRGLTGIKTNPSSRRLLFPASTGINPAQMIANTDWQSVPRKYGD